MSSTHTVQTKLLWAPPPTFDPQPKQRRPQRSDAFQKGDSLPGPSGTAKAGASAPASESGLKWTRTTCQLCYLMCSDRDVVVRYAFWAWHFFRMFDPNLAPWITRHDFGLRKTASPIFSECIPIDRPDFAQFISTATKRNSLPSSIRQPKAMMTLKTAECAHTATTKVYFRFQIKLLLACGLVGPLELAQYAYDLTDCSHLCGNWWCANPFHLIMELIARNQRRKNFKCKPGKCLCGQQPPCDIRQVPDQQAYFLKLLADKDAKAHLLAFCPHCNEEFAANSDLFYHILKRHHRVEASKPDDLAALSARLKFIHFDA